MLKKISLFVFGIACLYLYLFLTSGRSVLLELGKDVLADSDYFWYRDYEVTNNEDGFVLVFNVIGEMPEDNYAQDEALKMVDNYYMGNRQGVLSIEQQYENGSCLTKYDFDESILNTTCK